jgi:hypothetical protein
MGRWISPTPSYAVGGGRGALGWGGEEEGSGAVAFIGRGRERWVRIAESVSEYVLPLRFSFQTFLKTQEALHKIRSQTEKGIAYHIFFSNELVLHLDFNC